MLIDSNYNICTTMGLLYGLTILLTKIYLNLTMLYVRYK
ncbi:hypothetical protein NARC_30283 [Candidatus Nitrosocosmicus arcticus]|uniref:Uncharacterized protein n=1 Tax=Candidatus Nitrosocosmicus arcticus TaxID=2035267 RepID=A0A557SY94_9ARCH|nr:hypothetical protein NARC_30283 [Candidatus Nitrosocosmicus arcticus]